MILITTSLWILFIAYRANSDSWLIKAGLGVSHTENAIVSVIMAILLSAVATGSLWLTPSYLAIYWILFDMTLNKLREKELFYVGTTAWLDRIFQNNKSLFSIGVDQLIVKIIWLVISITMYVWFKK